VLFTAQRYASAVYAAVIVCLFVRPSHAVTVSKWLNVGSRVQRPRTLVFCSRSSGLNFNGLTPTPHDSPVTLVF